MPFSGRQPAPVVREQAVPASAGPAREHRGELWRAEVLAFAVIALLGLAAGWNALIPGVADWGDVVSAVIASLRLTGPVAAAFAAWTASQVRARRTQSTGRVRLRALAEPILVLLVVLASYALTTGALAAKTALDNEWGRLALAGLGMGALGLAAHVAVGWVAGWLLPGPITAFAVGALSYILVGWLSGSDGWIARLAPAVRQPYDLYSQWQPGVLLHQGLWLGGVTLTLIFAWAVLATRRPFFLAPLALCALTASGGAAMLYQSREAPQLAPDRVAHACHHWPITVCVHPAMTDGLPQLDSEFTDLATRLSGTPAAFSRVEQYPRDGRVPPRAGVAAIHLDDLATGFAEEAVADYVARLTPPTCTTGYQPVVAAWLRGDPLPRGPLQQASAWFSHLGESPRRAWLRAHYAKFSECRLSAADFTDTAVPQVGITGGSLTGWPAPNGGAPSPMATPPMMTPTTTPR